MKNRVYRTLALVLALALLGGSALAEIVTNANVWLRTGPGRNYDQITSYEKGKSLKFLGEVQMDERPIAWYKVSDGKNTGWISSVYSDPVNETLPEPTVTEAPAQAPVEASTEAPEAPVVEPESDREGDPSAADAALDAAKLFFESVTQGEADTQAQTEAPAGDVVELSAFYLDDLVTSANELGLIQYRQVESEVPFQYSNDAMILAGNQNVEHVEVFGAGYAVFGVQVGMSVGEAMACLNAAGLDYLPSMNCISYEHPAAESAAYADENGHDSCVNVYTDAENKVIEIDWSTYTG